jgi:hypothetical protein
MLVLVTMAWIAADVLLDRADVQGWPVAVAAFLGATAVLVSAILLGHGSTRPGPVAFVYSGVAIAFGCLVPLQFSSEHLPALPAALGQAVGPLLVAAALAVALASAPGLSRVRVGLAVVVALVAAAYTVSGPWLPESDAPFGFYTQFLYHTQFDAIGVFVFALALATGRIGRRARDVVTTVASGLVTIAGATAITYSLLLLVFHSQRWMLRVDEFVATDQAPMTLTALPAGAVLAVLALAPRALSSSSTPSTPSTSDEPPPPTVAGPAAAALAPEEELTAAAPAASAA